MPSLEEISRRKLLAAAASYNPVNNPQAASTIARGQRGAALAAAGGQPAFQGPGVQGKQLAARTSPPLAFAQQKPQPPVQPASPMIDYGKTSGVGPAPVGTVSTNFTSGPDRPIAGLSVQSPAAATGTGGGGIIPAAEARPVRTNAAVTPATKVATPPLSQPPTTRAPAFDVQKNYHGIQGVNRVMNHDVPGEAPLFTNNPSAAAAYGEMGGPGLTPPNGDPSVRARSGSPIGYGGPLAAPVVSQDAQGNTFTRTPGDTNTPAQANAGGGGTFSVVPGLFSGVSSGSEAALSEARHAAADRGDFAAVDNSYRTPEQKNAFIQQQAQNKILQNVGNAPANQLPQALAAVGALSGQAQEAAKGEQALAKGGIELQQAEQVQQANSMLTPMLQGLSDLNDTTDPDRKKRAAIFQQISQTLPAILALRGKTATALKSLGYTGIADPSGVTAGSVLNRDTGQTQPVGGAQGVAQPDGVYEVPGRGKVTVRGGQYFDEAGNPIQQ